MRQLLEVVVSVGCAVAGTANAAAVSETANTEFFMEASEK
jgi:hypothetical protein